MKFLVTVITLLSLAISPVLASDGWHLTTYMGGSLSASNSLKVHLNDLPDMDINARYRNRSFSDSHWWSFRLENALGEKLRGLELIHHKIYLQNTNDVLQGFSVSDGYNLLYYTIGKRHGLNRHRLGIGVVIAHPDAHIQGRPRYHRLGLPGHHLAGPSIQFNKERWLWENDRYFVSVDGKLTLSYAFVPLSDQDGEYAEMPDIAFHMSIGLGSKPEAFKQPGFKKVKGLLPLAYPMTVGSFILGTGFTP